MFLPLVPYLVPPWMDDNIIVRVSVYYPETVTKRVEATDLHSFSGGRSGRMLKTDGVPMGAVC
jgi:hypothetical protein